MGTVDADILVKKINSEHDLIMHTYWESWKPAKLEVLWIVQGEKFEDNGYLGTVISKDGGEPSDRYVIKKMMPKFNKIFLRYKKKVNKLK